MKKQEKDIIEEKQRDTKEMTKNTKKNTERKIVKNRKHI